LIPVNDTMRLQQMAARRSGRFLIIV